MASVQQPDSIELPVDELRDDLEACFTSTDKAGSYAHHEIFDQFPNPGLQVANIGTVGLPLSDRDAAALKQASHRAPFGKGTETVIDENVRKTWEVNASDIRMTNPKWQSWIQHTVVPRAVDHLGVESGAVRFTRAELYKLLLYEAGAHFKPHQDSEKAPRMYGTLVICLPSRHQGGEVVLSHGNSTYTWNSAASSDLDLSYATWYADVTHEVKEITTGHRLVLTYNLIDNEPTVSSHSAAAVAGTDTKLERILTRWDKSCVTSISGDIEYLNYCLNHKYTQASLRLANLKGHDKQIVNLAARVGLKAGYVVCLATLERTREGAVEEEGDDIYDEIDTTLKLPKVYNLDGEEIALNVPIEEESVVPRNTFADEGPDEEEFGGYTGNEGATTTLWYRRTVMIIIPKHNYIRLIVDPVVQSGEGIGDLARRLLEAYVKDENNEERRADLISLCSSALHASAEDRARESKYSSTIYGTPSMFTKFSDNDMAQIAVCIAKLSDPVMFTRLLRSLRSSIPPHVFADIAAHLSTDKFAEFKDVLAHALDQLNSITAKLLAIKDLRAGFDKQMMSFSPDKEGFLNMFDAWSRSLMKHVLLTKTLTTTEDAKALLRVAEVYRTEFLFDCILPYAKSNTTATPFVIEFLAALASQRRDQAPARRLSELENQLLEMSNSAVQTFNVAELGELAVRPCYHYGRSDVSKEGTPWGERSILRHVNGPAAALLYQELTSLEQNELATKLATKLVGQGRQLAKSAGSLYEKVLFSFLHSLRDNLRASGTFAIPPFFQQLAQDMFKSYLEDYVQQRPELPTDWSMPPIDCSCGDCASVNAFFKSQQTNHRFRAAQRRRDHVRDNLPNEKVGWHTESFGSPHTLVLTKTGNDYNNRVSSWKRRIAEARHVFASFNEADLQYLLQGIYASVTSFEMVNGQSSERQPLMELPSNGAIMYRPWQPSKSSSTIPAKRKANDVPMVDLTAD